MISAGIFTEAGVALLEASRLQGLPLVIDQAGVSRSILICDGTETSLGANAVLFPPTSIVFSSPAANVLRSQVLLDVLTQGLRTGTVGLYSNGTLVAIASFPGTADVITSADNKFYIVLDLYYLGMTVIGNSLKLATANVARAPLNSTPSQLGSHCEAVTYQGLDPSIYAKLDSPIFVGTPTAPTPAPGNNNARLATTAFVAVNFAPITNPHLLGAPTATTAAPGDSSSRIATTAFVMANANGANLNSPHFTGVPTAPTASPGTNTTQLATTAFVLANSSIFNLDSPHFTGAPTSPTASPGTSTTQLATTAFVQVAISSVTFTLPIASSTRLGGVKIGAGLGIIGDGTLSANVTAVAGRTGSINIGIGDVSGAAPLASPTFSGSVNAPTPSTGNNSTLVATTAFISLSYAPLSSPAFTGVPTAPTATLGTSSTQIATTAFVESSLTSYVPNSQLAIASGVATLDSSGKLNSSQIPATVTGGLSYQGVWDPNTNTPTLADGTGTRGYYYKVSHDGTYSIGGNSTWNVGDLIVYNSSTWDKVTGPIENVISVAGRIGVVVLAVADISGAAPLASPSLTGTPLAPTAATNTNNTQLATTAFVIGQAGSSTPFVNGSASVGSSLLYARQDHVHPTDSSRAAVASPSLTGVPTAPTASTGTNTAQLATTAFVTAAAATLGSGYLPLAGGTLSGSLYVVNSSPALILNNNVGGYIAIHGQIGGSTRWQVILSNGTAESGANAGSNFGIARFDDSGSYLDTPLFIARSTGVVSFVSSPTVPTPTTGDNTTKVSTTAFVQNIVASYLPLTGGTISGALAAGSLSINNSNPTINLNKSASGGVIQLIGYTNAIPRWNLQLGDGNAETGSNVGSNFSLYYYNDAGVLKGQVWSIPRTTGVVNFNSTPTFPTVSSADNSTHAATTAFVQTTVARYLPLTGGNLSGNLGINTSSYPSLILNKTTGANQLAGYNNSSLRWLVQLGNAAAESGGNSGSDFNIFNCSDTGTSIGSPMSIIRSTGQTNFSVPPAFPTLDAGTNNTQAATTAFVTTATSAYLPLTGGTMSGVLTISNAANSSIVLNKTSASASTDIYGQRGGLTRWWMQLGNGETETGSGNTGSNFYLSRYNDAGTYLDSPLYISRATGAIYTTPLYVANYLQATNASDSDHTLFVAGSSKAIRFGTTSTYALIESVNTALSTYQPLYFGGSYLAFTVSGVEKARFDTSGNLCIGVTSGTHNLEVAGTAYLGTTTTSSLYINANYPTFIMNKSTGGAVANQILGYTNNVVRWLMELGNPEPETGTGNVGSDFSLHRYGDAGNYLGISISITRSSGDMSFGSTPYFPTAAAGTNNTQGATTQFVATSFAPKANPSFTGDMYLTGRILSGAPSTGGIWVDGGTSQFFGSLSSTQMGLYNNGHWALVVDNTGAVTVPTVSYGSNDTQVATTAFVYNAFAKHIVFDSDFGCVGDNSTDDTTAITNFINHANANPGVEHRLRPLTYKITGVLPDINVSGVIIRGAGSDIHNSTTKIAGTILRYAGGSAIEHVIRITSVDSTSSLVLTNVQFTGIGIDCNALVNAALYMLSVTDSVVDVTVIDAIYVGLYMNVVANLASGEARDNQRNKVSISSRQQLTGALTGSALWCHGDEVANTSLNEFWVNCLHGTGTAIELKNSDNNIWRQIRTYATGALGSTYSVRCYGNASSTSYSYCRNELFEFTSSNRPILVDGSETFPGGQASTDHVLQHVDVGNEYHLPAVQTLGTIRLPYQAISVKGDANDVLIAAINTYSIGLSVQGTVRWKVDGAGGHLIPTSDYAYNIGGAVNRVGEFYAVNAHLTTIATGNVTAASSINTDYLYSCNGHTAISRSTAATSGGAYTQLFAADGTNVAIYLGASGGAYTDPTSYYRNSGHVFGSVGGVASYLTLNASVATLGTPTPAVNDNSGNIVTTAFLRNAKFGTIESYGGVANNSTDNVAAFNAMLADRGYVSFCGGKYYFASTITVSLATTQTLVMYGVGAEKTYLEFASGCGISVNLHDATCSMNVRELSMLSRGAGNSYGFYCNMTSTVGNPANTAQSIFSNVTFRGSDGWALTNYWLEPIYMGGVSNVCYNSVNMVGGGVGTVATGYGSNGVGITIEDNASAGWGNYPVAHIFQNCTINYYGVGIKVGNNMQGLVISNSNFTGDAIGFEILGGVVGLDMVTISNSQFNCYQYGVLIQPQCANIMLTGNLFISPGNRTGISGAVGIFIQTPLAYSISANSFTCTELTGTATSHTQNLLVIGPNVGGGGIITGNIFAGGASGINLQSGSVGANIQSNYYTDCTTNIAGSFTGHTIGGGSR
jgi:hypothetical protein